MDFKKIDQIRSFPKEVFDFLKYYVYMLIDPFDLQVYYVGMGKGNRVFQSMKSQNQLKLRSKHNWIKEKGAQPKVLFSRIGMDEKSAKHVEEALIDFIGKHNISNSLKTRYSKDYGKMSPWKVISRYLAKNDEIEVPAILLKPNVEFIDNYDDNHLYELTRKNWILKDEVMMQNAKFAFCIIENVVCEVYEIERWYPSEDSWNFIGKVASPEIKDKYFLLDVEKYYKGVIRPFIYLNVARKLN